MRNVKLWGIYDKGEETFGTERFDTLEQAEAHFEGTGGDYDYFEIRQTEESRIERTPKEQEKLDTERTETERATDFENAQRSTTFDQEVVRNARRLGINPDNFDDEKVLAEAVETRQSEQDAAEQKAEDDKIKPSEDENERS